MELAIQELLAKHKDIQELSLPLFYQTETQIMNFIRVDKHNKTAVYLCDNYHWLEKYLNNNYYTNGEFETNQRLWEREYTLWDALREDDPIYITSRNQFNIFTGVTFTIHQHSTVDFFNFGSSALNHQKNLEYKEQYMTFINSFYDKTEKLLKLSEQNALSLNGTTTHSPREKVNSNYLYLGPKYNYAYLTDRETDVCRYLIKGLSTQEAAAFMEISSRTIEKHVETIKLKLNCKNRFEMGYILGKLNIMGHQV